MGKKARIKREHGGRAETRPAPKSPGRRIALIATGAVILIGAVIAIVIAMNSGSAAAAASSAGGAANDDPLLSAALALDFHPTSAPGVGTIESMPASAATPPSASDLLPTGSPAPDFTLSTARGQTVQLSSFRGKSVLLEFFATWCPHCQAEAPHLEAIYSQLPHDRFAVLAVNADGEDAASVFAFERYFKLPYPALLDPSSQPGSFYQQGGAGHVTTLYHVSYYPTFYVIDPNGIIRWRTDNEQPDARLLQELRSASGT